MFLGTFNNNFLLKTFISTLSLISVANGQETSSETKEDEAENVDIIIVTGSNIRSRSKDFKTPSPVQTMGKTEIENTGALQVQDIFKGLTANSGSQTANRQTAMQGLSQFSLRGLGIGSTLTLINGRRGGLAPVTDSSGQLFTDINQYPTNMIGRVEILTDGASSTYGSEAVAGVVNIYTRDNFEGLELTSEARTSINQSFQFGAAFGTEFDKGHFTIFTNYYAQNGAIRSDFDFILKDNSLEDGPSGLFDSRTGSPGRYNLAIQDDTAKGGYSLNGPSTPDPNCAAAGGMLDGEYCLYHFLDQRRMIAAEERVQIFSKLDYELTDNLTTFTEVSFSRNEIRDIMGANRLIQTVTDTGYFVDKDHPFNFFISDGGEGITYAGPDAFANNPSLEAVDLIYRGRPLGSTYDGENAEEIITTFQNIRISTGFDYEINNNWVFHANYTWSNSGMNRITPREYDGEKFQEQLLLGTFNPFGTAIISPELISPKDGVSLAGNSQGDIDNFTFRRVDNSKVIQSVAEAVISGETPLNLPAGALAIAIGGQYRYLDLSDIPDGRWQTGNNGVLETVPPVFGTQGVYALFGEMAIPLFDRLEIQTALRYEDYGDQGGDTLDPKVSAKFDITDNLFVRGSWGTSFQTPSLRQLSGSVSIAGVVDPVDPTAGNFSVSIVTLGASGLTPQSSENVNLGLVFRSDDGFDVSVDYWTYDYKGLILPGADPQAIIDAVFAGDLPADRVIRDAVGQPQAIFATYENRGSAKATGFDIVARYSIDILSSSKVTFDLSSTIITKYLSSEFGDILGSRNFANGFGSTPNFKLNGGVTLNLENHTINVTTRYIGAYKDDQFDNPIDAQTTIDMRYSLFLEEFLGDGGATFGIGITNVFDKRPPLIHSRPLFDNEVHDPRGRIIYTTLKKLF